MPAKKDEHRQVVDQPLNRKDDGEDFEADLSRSDEEREARRKGESLSTDAASPVDPDDRQIIRGVNQEDRHHKRRLDD